VHPGRSEGAATNPTSRSFVQAMTSETWKAQEIAINGSALTRLLDAARKTQESV
jgi:hypothetical protein